MEAHSRPDVRGDLAGEDDHVCAALDLAQWARELVWIVCEVGVHPSEHVAVVDDEDVDVGRTAGARRESRRCSVR
jgi:hypothetical protein